MNKTLANNFHNQTALVTGGAGFIGSHLVDALVAGGAKVRVLDNFVSGHERNLAHHDQSKVDVVRGDIRDLKTCLDAAEGCSVIFHQAALGSVPRSIKLPATSLEVNVGGTTNVFTAARDKGISRVVYASSSSVYGDSEVLPKVEGDEGTPLSPYALSKWMNEELASLYVRSYDMCIVGLRYFNVYGPRQDPKGPYAAVIPRFIDALLGGSAPVIFGDGEQSRDFTYVLDAVQANLRAALAPVDQAAGRAFNIGATGQTTVNELAEALIAAAKVDVRPLHEPPREGDVRHSKASIDAARSALGYDPQTMFEEGLRMTWEGWERP